MGLFILSPVGTDLARPSGGLHIMCKRCGRDYYLITCHYLSPGEGADRVPGEGAGPYRTLSISLEFAGALVVSFSDSENVDAERYTHDTGDDQRPGDAPD